MNTISNFKRRGFVGELTRFAGDAARQRAEQFADQHGAIVIGGRELSYRGTKPCVVVLEPEAAIPANTTVLYRGQS